MLCSIATCLPDAISGASGKYLNRIAISIHMGRAPSKRTRSSGLVAPVISVPAPPSPTMASEELLFGSRSRVHFLPQHLFVAEGSATNATLATIRVGNPSRDTAVLLLAFDAPPVVDFLRNRPDSLSTPHLYRGKVEVRPSLPLPAEFRVFYDAKLCAFYVKLNCAPDARYRLKPASSPLTSPVTKVSVEADGTSVISPGTIVKRSSLTASLWSHMGEVVAATYNSQEGDCGSIVYTIDGPAGIHIGSASISSGKYNFYKPFGRPLSLGRQESVSGPRHQARFIREGLGSVRVRKGDLVHDIVWETKQAPKAAGSGKKVAKVKKEGIVGMSPAPSDYLGPRSSTPRDTVTAYVETLVNPWSTEIVRLPDRVVTPTAVAKFFANRTYSLANVASNGPNFLFGLNTRLNAAVPGSIYGTSSAALNSSGGLLTYAPEYACNPGNILTPIQWGSGSYANPSVKFGNALTGLDFIAGASAWGDDYGTSLTGTTPYISAYRALAAAIRVRIVGLPASQFMTPGKIYFAQVRYDREDLPITEQDFVVLEQKGRATHVSADAVREAGSKTVFMAPDGEEKFGMSSNLLPAPGLLITGSGSTSMARVFPDVSYATTQGSPLASIIPYTTAALTPTTSGVSGGADSANADSTTVLLVAYFGASDGVVLEVDYALVIEYIPNKSAPAGVDAHVQLPDSQAMDSIFSAAAVCTQARPMLIQAPGDKTISSIMPGFNGAHGEAARVRTELSKIARRRVGGTTNESWYLDIARALLPVASSWVGSWLDKKSSSK